MNLRHRQMQNSHPGECGGAMAGPICATLVPASNNDALLRRLGVDRARDHPKADQHRKRVNDPKTNEEVLRGAELAETCFGLRALLPSRGTGFPGP